MDLTLVVNGLDLSKKLAKYRAHKEVQYRHIITTLDDTEHPVSGTSRSVVSFSLFPMTDAESEQLASVLLDLVFESTFTINGNDSTETVRLVSNVENLFLLKSVDGQRRYNGGEIVLRGISGARR